MDDWKDSSPPCCQVKVKAKEATDDLNYRVPVTGITPAGKKVFIQLDYQTTGKFAQISAKYIITFFELSLFKFMQIHWYSFKLHQSTMLQGLVHMKSNQSSLTY